MHTALSVQYAHTSSLSALTATITSRLRLCNGKLLMVGGFQVTTYQVSVCKPGRSFGLATVSIESSHLFPRSFLGHWLFVVAATGY